MVELRPFGAMPSRSVTSFSDWVPAGAPAGIRQVASVSRCQQGFTLPFSAQAGTIESVVLPVPLSRRCSVTTQSYWVPGAFGSLSPKTPVTHFGPSTRPISSAMSIMAGRKLVSQIDWSTPLRPNAFTHSPTRTPGSAKLPSPADTQECTISGHGPAGSPLTDFFQLTE